MTAPRGYVTEAVVLREIPFGETSQVVHLSTPDHGLVAALAKGSRRPGGDFQGGVPLGAIGTASLAPRRGDALEVLRSFRSPVDLRGLGRDLARYYGACHVLELMRAWMRPALPLPNLHRAGAAALRLLAAAPPDAVAGWVVWFEARAVAAAGHRPRLDTCVACDEPAAAGCRFSPADGGVVHAGCAATGTTRRLAPAGLSALRRLYAARLPELVAEPLSAAEVREARAIHDLLLPWLLERRPNTLATVPRP